MLPRGGASGYPGAAMPENPFNIRYALKAAEALGCTAEIVDPFSHYLVRISRGGRSVLVGAGTVHGFPINSATSATLVGDKTHSYELLGRAGLRVPRSQLVFLSERFADYRPPGREVADARAFAQAIGYPVFVKPNAGSRGNLAQSVRDEAGLAAHFAAIERHYDSAVVQEVLRGVEKRLFAIDGVPQFGYTKTRPVLTGDGRRSIGALLDELDRSQVRTGLSAVNRADPVLEASLEAGGLDLESVLPDGAALAFSETANVSGGGGVTDFHTTFDDGEVALCRLVHQVTGLRVCAIDTIDGEDAAPVILELNANPALTSLEKLGETGLLVRIWTDILRKALGD
ncbi:MAG: hypothetical protein V4574_12975 [Pseudomonadota bacterium]